MSAIFLPYYRKADVNTVDKGLSWYPAAYDLVCRLSDLYSRSPRTVAGIVAALSQRARWEQNKIQAEICLQGDRPYGVSLAVRKALQIRSGAHPFDVLGPRAPKVTAFYRALMGDMQAVVLDTWMLYAAKLSGHTIRHMSLYQYEQLAYVLQCESELATLEPAAFQAVVWCQVRDNFN